MAKQKRIIDQQRFIEIITTGDYQKQKRAVGKALVHVFKRQTEDERKVNVTNTENGIGFTGADAHSGCITAKYFIKHGTLTDWQMDMWTKPNVNGIPRVAKYWKQVDEEAQKMHAARAQRQEQQQQMNFGA